MPDSQLVNSVYLDSPALELYHGRLNKTPGAVALRLRWYGTGEPTLVFVERKTHRDSWTGDGSVKERFVVTPDEVLPLLRWSGKNRSGSGFWRRCALVPIPVHPLTSAGP